MSGAKSSAWTMYRAMVGIGLLCGLSIVSVFELTRPVIARNRAEALQRAIFRVLPDATSSETFRYEESGGFQIDGEDVSVQRVHAGYDDGGRLLGVAIEAQGMGYQDVIGILYGYSIESEAVIGIQVLETKETPGLGDKIEKDPVFLRNFERLDVSLSADGSRVQNPIEFVKPGKKQQPWQVDGITGATISSTAIAEILKESTAYWIPRIRRDPDDLERTR